MILVIIYSGQKNSVALYSSVKKMASFSWNTKIGQAGKLLISISKLFSGKIKLKNLQKIVVYRGPGSYTSLRIAITLANTLGFTLDIPVVGITQNDLSEGIIGYLKRPTKTTGTSVRKNIIPLYD